MAHSFLKHIQSKEESVSYATEYILSNPVMKGLVWGRCKWCDLMTNIKCRDRSHDTADDDWGSSRGEEKARYLRQ